VQLPWLIYERYGDRELLERAFPAMLTWLELVHRDNPDGIWRHGRGNDYGDWVPAGPDTSHDLFSTSWLYRSSVVGRQVADLVGDAHASQWLAERAEVVRRAFLERYVDPSRGQVRDLAPAGSPAAQRFAPVTAPETQTGYVVALAHGLLQGELAEKAGRRLVELVVDAGRRLETGFAGSAFLLAALEQAGSPGLAYDLLLRQGPPSLGFMISRGATSVWERWDGLDAEGWPACPTMNSFNHYAMSSMLSWLVEGVCGLRPAPGIPALGEIRFAPALSRRVHDVGFDLAAPAGLLALGWEWDGDDRVVGSVRVPPGMRCTIAGTVSVDDDVRGAVEEGAGTGCPRERVVGAGDHEVVWQVRR
jgi:alpha-L-rhamnosidase